MTPHPSQPLATPRDPSASLSARLLGPVHLAVNGRSLPVALWHRRGARALLLLLLATTGHRLPRERAVDLLWPDHAPDRVRATWYQTLATLRRVLEPDLPARQASAFLEVDATTIALNPQAVRWIDVDAFELTLRRAGSGSPDEQRAHLRAALALYGGDLLAEEPEAHWVTARREELRRARSQAAVQLAALDRQAGEPLATVTALQEILAADRAAEDVHQALIHAYVAAGESERALRQYECCRRALWDDLGIEPCDTTRHLIGHSAPGWTIATPWILATTGSLRSSDCAVSPAATMNLSAAAARPGVTAKSAPRSKRTST